jgi:hypothetical protein
MEHPIKTSFIFKTFSSFLTPPILTMAIILIALYFPHIQAGESDNWQVNHPEWLWCDGFESGEALTVNYQDVSARVPYMPPKIWQ